MYVISESAQKVSGQLVPTFQRNIVTEAANLIVEAGTNASRGRCSRKQAVQGFFSILSLEGGFDFIPITDDEDFVTGVEITCCGEGSLNAFLKALEFARQAISEQRANYNS